MNTLSKAVLIHLASAGIFLSSTQVVLAVEAQAAAPAAAAAVSADSSKPMDQKTFEQNLASIGVTYKHTGEDVDVTVDVPKAIESLPKLEAEQVVPKIDQNDAKNAPVSVVVGAVAVSFTIIAFGNVFDQNPSLDKIHVKGYVLPPGGGEKQLCYSFDYNRAMYKKINMDTLTPNTFMSSTPGFTFSDWCNKKMAEEEKATAPADKK